MNDKFNFKQYKICWLSTPFHIGNGLAAIDVIRSSECKDLFTSEQIKECKKQSYLKELKMYNLSDIINFYCNRYGYSVVSLSSNTNGYYILTLLKD